MINDRSLEDYFPQGTLQYIVKQPIVLTQTETAYDILVNGTDPGTMEIKTAENVTKKYNKTICDALNITIPEGYEAITEE